MTNFNALLKMTSMIERINENVFRVSRSELKHSPAEIFEQIHEAVKTHHTCLIVTNRHKADINGSAKLIQDVEVDYRSQSLIVVHKNPAYPVYVCDHTFEVILDRYGKVESVVEPEFHIDLLTIPDVAGMILSEYKKQYQI